MRAAAKQPSPTSIARSGVFLGAPACYLPPMASPPSRSSFNLASHGCFVDLLASTQLPHLLSFLLRRHQASLLHHTSFIFSFCLEFKQFHLPDLKLSTTTPFPDFAASIHSLTYHLPGPSLVRFVPPVSFDFDLTCLVDRLLFELAMEDVHLLPPYPQLVSFVGRHNNHKSLMAVRFAQRHYVSTLLPVCSSAIEEPNNPAPLQSTTMLPPPFRAIDSITTTHLLLPNQRAMNNEPPAPPSLVFVQVNLILTLPFIVILYNVMVLRRALQSSYPSIVSLWLESYKSNKNVVLFQWSIITSCSLATES